MLACPFFGISDAPQPREDRPVYVAINPLKCQRFITQGLNLTPGNPVGYVGAEMLPHCRRRVDEALALGEIEVVPDDLAKGYSVAGQGSVGAVADAEDEPIGRIEFDYEERDGVKVVVGQRLVFAPREPAAAAPLVVIAE